MFVIVWAIFVNTVDNFTKPWLIGFDIARTMSLTTWAFLVGLSRSASWVCLSDRPQSRPRSRCSRHGAPPSLITWSQK